MKTTIIIVTAHGNMLIKADCRDGLAVHKEAYRRPSNEKAFTVTHIKTGLKCSPVFKTQQEALRLRNELVKVFDWETLDTKNAFDMQKALNHVSFQVKNLKEGII
mgnify:CR=1 FL=1